MRKGCRNIRMMALFVLFMAVVPALGACGNVKNTPDTNSAAQQGAEGTASAEGAALAGDDAGKDAAQDEEGDASGEDTAAGSEAVQYPLTLTDQLGREVVIEKEPETLVSGYYISSSLLIALGQQEKLVGIEAKADTRPIYALAAPGLLKLPSVGTAKEFDLEGCAALAPDLVIVPAKLKESIPAMEELGMTVLAVNPEDREQFAETARLLGEATNTRERADKLLEESGEYLAQMRAAVEKEEQPSVYLAGNSSFLSTAGGEMYQNALIEQAGGANVAAELSDSYWAEISYEQLLAWDPEYIILAADAEYTAESVLEDAQLAECAAVKNGQVYQIPGNIEAWDSPVPGSVMGSLWLASVLHPQQYPADMYEQAVVDFYGQFYGFEPEI